MQIMFTKRKLQKESFHSFHHDETDLHDRIEDKILKIFTATETL